MESYKRKKRVSDVDIGNPFLFVGPLGFEPRTT